MRPHNLPELPRRSKSSFSDWPDAGKVSPQTSGLQIDITPQMRRQQANFDVVTK
jgi:hypothetical protein